MTDNKDIRWIQRLNNYEKAFKQLESGVELATDKNFNDLEKEGLIQRFEYTQELAWKVIKDFYQSAGEFEIHGSRDAFSIAFKRGLVKSDVLMQTIKSRQQTVHTYNKEVADKIYHDVIEQYFDAFQELANNLQQQKEKIEK